MGTAHDRRHPCLDGFGNVARRKLLEIVGVAKDKRQVAEGGVIEVGPGIEGLDECGKSGGRGLRHNSRR